MHYTYEGDNDDLEKYLENNDFHWSFDTNTSEICLIKQDKGIHLISPKTYIKSREIDMGIPEEELQNVIAGFIRKAVVDIEVEILKDKLEWEMYKSCSKLTKELSYKLECLGVHPVPNYSEKEIASWEREYIREQQEVLDRRLGFERMGR